MKRRRPIGAQARAIGDERRSHEDERDFGVHKAVIREPIEKRSTDHDSDACDVFGCPLCLENQGAA